MTNLFLSLTVMKPLTSKLWEDFLLEWNKKLPNCLEFNHYQLCRLCIWLKECKSLSWVQGLLIFRNSKDVFNVSRRCCKEKVPDRQIDILDRLWNEKFKVHSFDSWYQKCLLFQAKHLFLYCLLIHQLSADCKWYCLLGK